MSDQPLLVPDMPRIRRLVEGKGESVTDATGSLSPCAYPTCQDQDGNRRLTHNGVCEPCRHRYRHVLYWLTLDYVTLKATLPRPSFGRDGTYESPKQKSFGHPAEWASVTCTEIAQALNWAEDGLRDFLGHSPGIRPNARENIVVAHGWRYLTAQFDGLCTYPAAEDTATELTDLHRKIYSALGRNRAVQRLPVPCPWCDAAGMVRTVGRIDCTNCGKTIDEAHYEWFARRVVDQLFSGLIEAYDTPEQHSA